MSKANKAALNWLPKRKDGRKRFYQCNDDDIRSIYAKGYRKAEKDLELTWEDMRELYIIFAEVNVEIELCKADNIISETIGYYQEVLKRFKNMKDGSKR